MDEQLKRRLVGAAVISGLAVLIVPQFFEDKSPTDSAGLPQPLELPRQTGAAAPEADPQSVSRETTEAPARKRKYEVVPLDDAPVAAPQPAPVTQEAAVATTPSAAAAPEATVETPAYRDEDAEAPAPLIKPRAASSRSAQSTKSKPVNRPPAESVSAPTPAKKARPPTAEASVPPAAPKPKAAASKPGRTEASASPKPAKSSKTAKPVAEAGTTPRTPENSAPKPAPTVKKEGEKPAKKTAAAAPGKPAATKSGKGSSWTVQAGTFADEANAKKLADKLKKSGLPVKIHSAEGSSGKVYRVTVGSSLERARAEKVQKNLSSQHGVKGMMLENR